MMRGRAHLRLAAASALCIAAPGIAQTVQDRATAAATLSRSRSADSKTLLQSYVTPGLSGQPVATLDNKTSFTATLACEKSAKLLEILAQPSATGDLGMVRISRDTDLDGTFDQSLTLPMPVSGICSNGIISCTPGTWEACKNFRWDVGQASDLKLTQVDLPALAGCACINNSCGTHLAAANMPSVLSALGGGVVGALTTADPRYGVAEAQIDGPVIDYVGAQTTACTSTPAVTQTAYASHPTAISGDATAQAGNDPIFQMLKGSPAGVGKAAETRSCTIERQITLTSPTYDDIVTATGSFESVSSCGTGCRRYRLGGSGNCDTPPPTYTAHFTVSQPDRLTSARLTTIQTDDFFQARINGMPVASAGPDPWLTNTVPGACATAKSFSAAPNIDFTQTLKAGQTSVDARVHAHGSKNQGTLEVEIQVDTGCRASEQLTDLCSGYAAQSQCSLQSETVDGVQTVTAGVVTGLRPLAQTRLFGNASCTLSLTRDFFERDRSYRCITDSSGQTAPDLSRAAYIIDHSTETLLADQTTSADGTVTTSSSVFSLPDRGTVPACEAICKTRAAKANTDAAPAGVVGAEQNDPTGWDIFYHACQADSVCPAGAGEEIVTPCGCLDSFPEAATMMQTVRLAGADLACTATTP